MFIKLTNGEPTPYTIGQLRKDNPNVSFPRAIPDETLAEYDVYNLKLAQYPSYNEKTQYVEKGDIEQVDGEWIQQWNVIDKPILGLAREIRKERDQLLTESDWTQVADAPVDQTAWATYRQALRDVPSQEGFPSDVTWPTKPITLVGEDLSPVEEI